MLVLLAVSAITYQHHTQTLPKHHKTAMRGQARNGSGMRSALSPPCEGLQGWLFRGEAGSSWIQRGSWRKAEGEASGLGAEVARPARGCVEVCARARWRCLAWRCRPSRRLRDLYHSSLASLVGPFVHLGSAVGLPGIRRLKSSIHVDFDLSPRIAVVSWVAGEGLCGGGGWLMQGVSGW